MKKLKAYWLRYWHCLYYGIKDIDKKGLEDDHRAHTESVNGNTTFIGCCCGKKYYGESLVPDEVYKKIAEKLKNTYGKVN